MLHQRAIDASLCYVNDQISSSQCDCVVNYCFHRFAQAEARNQRFSISLRSDTNDFLFLLQTETLNGPRNDSCFYHPGQIQGYAVSRAKVDRSLESMPRFKGSQCIHILFFITLWNPRDRARCAGCDTRFSFWRFHLESQCDQADSGTMSHSPRRSFWQTPQTSACRRFNATIAQRQRERENRKAARVNNFGDLWAQIIKSPSLSFSLSLSNCETTATFVMVSMFWVSRARGWLSWENTSTNAIENRNLEIEWSENWDLRIASRASVDLHITARVRSFALVPLPFRNRNKPPHFRNTFGMPINSE